MLAVFKTGGKQYSVKAGQILKVEKLEGEKGDSISFKDVLAISESTQNTIGSPLVEGAVVEAKILDQIRDKKIIVFKKRKRQNYRSTQGHRQYLTVLKIETISMGGKKSQSEKKEAKTKTILINIFFIACFLGIRSFNNSWFTYRHYFTISFMVIYTCGLVTCAYQKSINTKKNKYKKNRGS